MALLGFATARTTTGKDRGMSRGLRRRLRKCGKGLALAACAWPSAALAGNNVRITALSDVSFGTLANLSSDAVRSQNICVYSNSSTNGYHVQATGSGSGGAFTLASGSASLAYEVQWAQLSGQTSGAQLSPNVSLTGQVSSATQQSCNSGPSSSASLIVILRSAKLSAAAAGSYSGTLTLLVAPE